MDVTAAVTLSRFFLAWLITFCCLVKFLSMLATDFCILSPSLYRFASVAESAFSCSKMSPAVASWLLDVLSLVVFWLLFSLVGIDNPSFHCIIRFCVIVDITAVVYDATILRVRHYYIQVYTVHGYHTQNKRTTVAKPLCVCHKEYKKMKLGFVVFIFPDYYLPLLETVRNIDYPLISRTSEF